MTSQTPTDTHRRRRTPTDTLTPTHTSYVHHSSSQLSVHKAFALTARDPGIWRNLRIMQKEVYLCKARATCDEVACNWAGHVVHSRYIFTFSPSPSLSVRPSFPLSRGLFVPFSLCLCFLVLIFKKNIRYVSRTHDILCHVVMTYDNFSQVIINEDKLS